MLPHLSIISNEMHILFFHDTEANMRHINKNSNINDICTLKTSRFISSHSPICNMPQKYISAGKFNCNAI